MVAHAEPALAYATAFDGAVVIEHAKVTAIDAETGEETVIFDDAVSPTAIADGLARHARKVDNTYRVQFEWTELDGQMSVLNIVDPTTGEVLETFVGSDLEGMGFESLMPGVTLPPWADDPSEGYEENEQDDL